MLYLNGQRPRIEQEADIERIVALDGEALYAAVDQLIRQRDALIWELKRAEKENSNLHDRIERSNRGRHLGSR